MISNPHPVTYPEPGGPWQDETGLNEAGCISYSELHILVSLAQKMFGTSAAFISILGRQYQWFLAGSGLDTSPTPLTVSVCKTIVFDQGSCCVPDTHAEASLAGNPYVSVPGGIRFYAGVPIIIEHPDTGAKTCGAFCIADTVPRNRDEIDLKQLADLASIAQSLIEARIQKFKAMSALDELRLSHKSIARREVQLLQAEKLVAIGSWRLNIETQEIEWSPGVYAIHELPIAKTPPLATALSYYPQEARAMLEHAIGSAIKIGKSFDLYLDFLPHPDRPKRVHVVGDVEYDEGKAVGVIGVFRDVTSQYALEQSLEARATTDPLTGLNNRAWAERTLDQIIAENGPHLPLAVLMIDLNGFKAVNDSGGHARGDAALVTVANRIRSFIRPGCSVARYGGDEFIVILHGSDNARSVHQLAPAIDAALNFTVACAGHSIWISAALGVATLQGGDTRDSLIDRADRQMYLAKAAA